MPLGIAAVAVGILLAYSGYKGARIRDVVAQAVGKGAATVPASTAGIDAVIGQNKNPVGTGTATLDPLDPLGLLTPNPAPIIAPPKTVTLVPKAGGGKTVTDLLDPLGLIGRK